MQLELADQRVEELEARLAAAEAPREARGPEDCELHSSELADLRAQLAREQDLRLAREREWLEFTRTLGSLELPLPAEASFEAQVPANESPAAEPEPPPPDPALAERQRAILRSLRTLLAIEGVRGLDLLEVGALGEGCTGPVVFRLLDERGRLAGSLWAERLRLEGSRTARTLTLVLENGYEAHDGERFDFAREERLDAPPIEGGVRRIELAETDPMPWVAALGELFGDVTLEAPKDDGRWNLTYVKGALNRLLKADTANGYWRVKSLGGVTGDVLREVQLEGFDGAGKLERRVFADSLRILRQDKGVSLQLEDGAQMRGDEKLPFLDGRFRIYLPRALQVDWERAGLPGWSQPPAEPSEPEKRSG